MSLKGKMDLHVSTQENDLRILGEEADNLSLIEMTDILIEIMEMIISNVKF